MKIIFTGKMASGKTALASYLITHRNFTKIALADPIKRIEADLEVLQPMQIVEKHLPILDSMEAAMFCKILDEAKAIPREYPKPRKRLQFIGTEGGRQRISDDIWIRLADYATQDKDSVCIDDVRFYNEFQHFTKRGWTSIGLIVDPMVQMQRLTLLYGEVDPAILEHASEKDTERILVDIPMDRWINTSQTTVDEAGIKLLEMLKI